MTKVNRDPRLAGFRGFLLRHGLRAWMVWAVLLMVLFFAGFLYILDRGTRLQIPAPATVQLPTPP